MAVHRKVLRMFDQPYALNYCSPKLEVLMLRRWRREASTVTVDFGLLLDWFGNLEVDITALHGIEKCQDDEDTENQQGEREDQQIELVVIEQMHEEQGHEDGLYRGDGKRHDQIKRAQRDE